MYFYQQIRDMYAPGKHLEELFSFVEYDSDLNANGQLIVAHHKAIYLGRSKKTGMYCYC